MRLAVRWGAAVAVSAAGFVLSWWARGNGPGGPSDSSGRAVVLLCVKGGSAGPAPGICGTTRPPPLNRLGHQRGLGRFANTVYGAVGVPVGAGGYGVAGGCAPATSGGLLVENAR